jgi:hypothetical protein
MRTIYIDSDNKCHVTDDGTMTAVETDFFDGKCDSFVEGFCCEVREGGTAIYPWKDYEELDSIQRDYEKQLIIQLQNKNAEYEAALSEVGVNL